MGEERFRMSSTSTEITFGYEFYGNLIPTWSTGAGIAKSTYQREYVMSTDA